MFPDCHPQGVSLVSFPLQLSSFTRKQLYRRRQQAYASGSLQWVKRIHALLALTQGQNVHEGAERLALGEQTVRAYRTAFLSHGMASLVYQAPPGRPSQLTKTQRQQLAEWIKARPQDCGSTSGGWHTPMMQDLIERRFGVPYPPHDIATFLHNMGFSSQQARCVSEHLKEAKRLEGRHTRWPKILRQAQQRKDLLLCGDAARFAQWGSLSYTWALRGQPPEVPTSGKRQASKSFGLIDSFSGQVFYTSQPGRFNSASDAAFRLDVLSQTKKHVIVIQDGARYHTSKAMQQFFTAHADRLPLEQLPAYAPDFNPIEPLWKQVKKEATHLKHFPEFTDLQQAVDRALLHFAQTPSDITVLMARYCEKLGKVDKAA
jgi:transposase